MKITTLTISLIAVAVVFAGCGITSDQDQNNIDIYQDDTKEAVVSDNWVGTMADALLNRRGMKCTWSAENGIESVGYIKNEKMYSETEISGKKTFMLSKNNCTWIWEESGSEGMKICADDDSIDEGLDDYNEDDYDFEEYEGFNNDLYEMNTDVNCVNQDIKDSVFNEPDDIFFVNPYEVFLHDLDSMMQY